MNCVDYDPSDELLAALAEHPSGLRPEHVKPEVDGRQQYFLIAEFEPDDLRP